jgi:4-oxalocrotonate tautomerase family enzyme
MRIEPPTAWLSASGTYGSWASRSPNARPSQQSIGSLKRRPSNGRPSSVTDQGTMRGPSNGVSLGVTPKRDPGATPKQERELERRLTEVAVDVPGVDPITVTVFIEEVPPENFARGGTLAPDRTIARTRDE